jgi:hypothetical protein
MQLATTFAALCCFSLVGCGSKVEMREEPVEITGSVKLPGNASPKGLTITFAPQQNSPPAGAKLDSDGRFTVKVQPGKYIPYFQDEANAAVPAYKQIPESYRTPKQENVMEIQAGQNVSIEVK